MSWNNKEEIKKNMHGTTMKIIQGVTQTGMELKS